MSSTSGNVQDFTGLANTIGEKLDVPGKDLATVVSRAGRMLPRRLRREAQYLVQAETLSSHPKLRHLVDTDRIARADRALRAYVKTKDPEKERRDRTLGQIAAYVFNILIFVALLITVLTWRGVLGPQ